MTRKKAGSASQRVFAALAALLFATTAARAEAVKIGGVKTSAAGALYIATEKGYFAAAGIEPQFIDFDSPGAVPVAVVSGAVDIGATGVSAGLYSLAAQGALKIIAGQAHETKGYQVNAFIVSNAASAAGLARFDQLAGHSVAISQIGSPVHYAASQVALKHGVALASLRFLPLQSNPNIVSAVTGGTDALGEARVVCEIDGRNYSGQGVSTDVLEATAVAYLRAVDASRRAGYGERVMAGGV